MAGGLQALDRLGLRAMPLEQNRLERREHRGFAHLVGANDEIQTVGHAGDPDRPIELAELLELEGAQLHVAQLAVLGVQAQQRPRGDLARRLVRIVGHGAQGLSGDAHEPAVRDRLQVRGRRPEVQPPVVDPQEAQRRPDRPGRGPAARDRQASVPSRRRSRSRHAGSSWTAPSRALMTSTSSRRRSASLVAPVETPGPERGHGGQGAGRRDVHEQRVARLPRRSRRLQGVPEYQQRGPMRLVPCQSPSAR